MCSLQKELLRVISFWLNCCVLASMSIAKFIVSRKKEKKTKRKRRETKWSYRIRTQRHDVQKKKKPVFQISVKRNHIVNSGFQVLKGLFNGVLPVNWLCALMLLHVQLVLVFVWFCTFNITVRVVFYFSAVLGFLSSDTYTCLVFVCCMHAMHIWRMHVLNSLNVHVSFRFVWLAAMCVQRCECICFRFCSYFLHGNNLTITTITYCVQHFEFLSISNHCPSLVCTRDELAALYLWKHRKKKTKYSESVYCKAIFWFEYVLVSRTNARIQRVINKVKNRSFSSHKHFNFLNEYANKTTATHIHVPAFFFASIRQR